jgi:hypothetical protein
MRRHGRTEAVVAASARYALVSTVISIGLVALAAAEHRPGHEPVQRFHTKI